MFEPSARVQPAADRQALSTVAYGFIASKALFAAMNPYATVESAWRSAAEIGRAHV